MSTTKCSFDSATLADAVTKAARVAPSKGAEYDKAAGIMFEVNPALELAEIKATNLDVTYRQVLRITDAKGDFAKWRIPSSVLAGLVGQLNLQSGSVTTFIDPGDKAIRIKSGTVTVRLNMIEGDFPAITEFDPSTLTEANEFAQRIAQVTWACDKDNSNILSGVHIDGTRIIACNRFAAATMPCPIEIKNPITVALWTVTPILKNATDVRMGATDSELLLQLDTESQATARVFEGGYPDVKAFTRDNFQGKVVLPKTQFVEAVNRLLVVAAGERLPTVKLTFNPGLIKSCVLDLEVTETGRIQDTIDIEGEYDDPFEILFTPSVLVPSIENSKADKLYFEYGNSDKPALATKMPCRLSDDLGYEVMLMPRQPG